MCESENSLFRDSEIVYSGKLYFVKCPSFCISSQISFVSTFYVTATLQDNVDVLSA